VGTVGIDLYTRAIMYFYRGLAVFATFCSSGQGLRPGIRYLPGFNDIWAGAACDAANGNVSPDVDLPSSLPTTNLKVQMRPTHILILRQHLSIMLHIPQPPKDSNALHHLPR